MINVKSEGRVNSDGDFCAILELDISTLGAEDSIVYAQGKVEATIGGASESQETYGEEVVSQSPLELNSSWLQVDKDVDPNYSVAADLEIFLFSEPNVIEIVLPKESGEIAVDSTFEGFKISKITCNWEVDDGQCEIVIIGVLEGHSPYGILTSLEAKEDDEETYPYSHDVYVFYNEKFEINNFIYDSSPGDKVPITIEIGNQLDDTGSISSTGIAEIDKRSADNEGDKDDDDKSGNQDGFEGVVHVITVQRSEHVDEFDRLSASNGSMQGPEKTFYLAYDSGLEDYHLVVKGEEYFHVSSDEFDWKAPIHALENIREQLAKEFFLNSEQVDQLLSYIQANVTDEADEIDKANFTHIVTTFGEVNGKDYFKDEGDASDRLWISTAENLSYINISLDKGAKSLDFDEETLEEKEVASWSTFKLV